MSSNNELPLAKLITNPIQIESMFGGDLSLKNITLETLLLTVGPDLRLGFYTKQLPEIVPRKWELSKFTSMRFVLIFSGIHSIRITHWEPLMSCSPKIEAGDKSVSISISRKGENVVLCESDFVSIQDVRGFLE